MHRRDKSLGAKERAAGTPNLYAPPDGGLRTFQLDIILLGGLSGRLDQTIHTLSYLHKLRATRPRTYAITDDNIGWVLDAVSFGCCSLCANTHCKFRHIKGEHIIPIDSAILGPTCGLLPVGIASTTLTTKGLKWNLGKATTAIVKLC